MRPCLPLVVSSIGERWGFLFAVEHHRTVFRKKKNTYDSWLLWYIFLRVAVIIALWMALKRGGASTLDRLHFASIRCTVCYMLQRTHRGPSCHLIIQNPLCSEGPCLAPLHPGISGHLSDALPPGAVVYILGEGWVTCGASYRSVVVRAVRSSAHRSSPGHTCQSGRKSSQVMRLH